MAGIEDFTSGIRHIRQLVERTDLEPDPLRARWDRPMLDSARFTFENIIYRQLHAAVDEVGLENARSVRDAVAGLTSQLAALFCAAGDQQTCRNLLERAKQITADDRQRAELDAGLRDPEGHRQLTHARWLTARNHHRSYKVFRRVLRSSHEPALQQAAAKALEEPRPLKRNPSLFLLAGCGVKLDIAHDSSSGGERTATTYLNLFFIPILPLASYRVRLEGGVQFLGRVALDGRRRLWQLGFALAIACSASAITALIYLRSPEHRARVAWEQAWRQEQSHQLTEALSGYDLILRNYSASASAPLLSRAAEGWIRLRCAAIGEPFSRQQLGEVSRIALRFSALPRGARDGPATELWTHTLQGWSEQLSNHSIEDLEASLRLLDVAQWTPTVPVDLKEARADRHRRLGGLLARDWPIQALMHLVLAGDDAGSLAAAAAVIESVSDSDSLLVEAREDAELWARLAALHPEHVQAVARLKTRLAEALKHSTAPERKALLNSVDESSLIAALETRPHDQELALAVAELQAGRGDSSAAKATLTRLGSPGCLIAAAQLALAVQYQQSGELEAAEKILDRYVAHRLPRFQDARMAYSAAIKELSNEQDRARSGLDFRALLGKAKPTKGSGTASSGRDPVSQLESLRREYERLGTVVSASISLGMTKLRRAVAAQGADRSRLLSEAEQAFLAIREEAEGSTSFQIGLGQLYHRLGRAEEGDRELSRLLSEKRSSTDLEVATAYRELGLTSTARRIAEAVHRRGEKETRDHAAVFLAVLAVSLDEKEKWLLRADQDNERVQTELADVRASRLLRQGKLADADREFARVASVYVRQADHNSTASNNAALAFQERYVCTGDRAHLEKATQLLEAALHAQPDEPIVMSNLSSVLAHRASIAVLDRWIHTAPLRLSEPDASALLDLLLQGDKGPSIRVALGQERSLRQSLLIARQQEVLAPRSPEPYIHQLRWYSRIASGAEISGLEARAQRVHSFDLSDISEKDDARERDSLDREQRGALEAKIRLLQTTIQELKQNPHGPTLAAAYALLSDKLSDRIRYGGGVPDMQEAVHALESADSAWPGAGYRRATGILRFHLAAVTAFTEQTAMPGWRQQLRRIQLEPIVYRAALEDAALRRVLGDAPAVRRAALEIASGSAADVGLTDWLVAWLLDDERSRVAIEDELRHGPTAAEQALSRRFVAEDWASEARARLVAAALNTGARQN